MSPAHNNDLIIIKIIIAIVGSPNYELMTRSGRGSVGSAGVVTMTLTKKPHVPQCQGIIYLMPPPTLAKNGGNEQRAGEWNGGCIYVLVWEELKLL